MSRLPDVRPGSSVCLATGAEPFPNWLSSSTVPLTPGFPTAESAGSEGNPASSGASDWPLSEGNGADSDCTAPCWEEAAVSVRMFLEITVEQQEEEVVKIQ